jgi:hypothetical protein
MSHGAGWAEEGLIYGGLLLVFPRVRVSQMWYHSSLSKKIVRVSPFFCRKSQVQAVDLRTISELIVVGLVQNRMFLWIDLFFESVNFFVVIPHF